MVNGFKSDTVVLCLVTTDIIIQNEVTDIATKYFILKGKIRNIAPERDILTSAVAYHLHENSQCLKALIFLIVLSDYFVQDLTNASLLTCVTNSGACHPRGCRTPVGYEVRGAGGPKPIDLLYFSLWF